MSFLRTIAQGGERARLESVLRAQRGLTSINPWRVVGEPGNPSFQGTWGHAPGFPQVAFFRDAIGFVHFRGFAKHGTSEAETIMFYLPLGYRPSRPIAETVANDMSNVGSSPGYVVRMDFGAVDGRVFFPHAYSAGWICLDGCRFRAY